MSSAPAADLPLHRTAQAAVAQRLRQEILSGHLAPGTRLIQSDVAARLGVSTTPVREAMRELASQGLLDGDPHKGWLVHQPTLPELVEVYELRAILEPVNIRKVAARITEAELAEAAALVDQMDGIDEPAAWVQLNSRFHEIVTDASRSPRLMEFLRNLRNISSLYVGIFAQQTPERLAHANEEHRAIVDACRVRNGDRAAEVLEVHVNESLEIVRRLLLEEDRAGDKS